MGTTKRRQVTNEEFNRALVCVDNIKIIKHVTSKYANIIPQENLYSCGLSALWRALGYHRPEYKTKFTTSLWRFTEWECKRELKSLQRGFKHQVAWGTKFSSLEAKPANENVTYMRECIDKLEPQDKVIIKEYYIDGLTMEELGATHGYSKQTAQTKIDIAVRALKKICLDGV